MLDLVGVNDSGTIVNATTLDPLTVPVDPSEVLAPLAPGEALTVDDQGRPASLGPVVSRDAGEQIAAPPIGGELLSAMAQDSRDVSLLVLGDSTGVDGVPAGGGVNWVRRVAVALGQRYPAYTVEYRTWTDDAGAISGSWAAPVQLQAGSGTYKLTVWNGSVGGKVESYPLGGRFAAMVDTPVPDLVFLGYGHNNGAETFRFRWRMTALVERILWQQPQAEVVLLTQNPATANTSQQARVGEIMRLARQKSLPIAHTLRAFQRDPRGVAALLNGDGIHPNADGSQLWADVVLGQLREPTYREAHLQRPSGLTIAGESLLVNGAFEEWDAGSPVGWTLANATVSQDATNRFPGSSVGCKVEPTAPQAFGSYLRQDLPLERVRGRVVTVIAWLHVPSGQANDVRLGIVGLSDSASNSTTGTTRASQQCRDSLYCEVIQRRIPADATFARVLLYGTTGNHAGTVVTFARACAVIGDEVREFLPPPAAA